LRTPPKKKSRKKQKSRKAKSREAEQRRSIEAKKHKSRIKGRIEKQKRKKQRSRKSKEAGKQKSPKNAQNGKTQFLPKVALLIIHPDFYIWRPKITWQMLVSQAAKPRPCGGLGPKTSRSSLQRL
jgi:hypothetical protein